jgi:nicotinamidase-related amidase
MEDRSSALLVIDVQIGLVELAPPELQSSVLSKIKTLLTKARASGIAVIFIQHDGPKGHPLETRTKGWGIHPSFNPVGGEPIVRKRESDSFFEDRPSRGTWKKRRYQPHRRWGNDRVLCGHHLPTCDDSRL